MKKKVKNVILFIIFLIGLSIFLYPIITGYISYHNGLWKIKMYEQNISDIPTEDYSDILEKAREYNQDLFNNSGETIADENRYYDQLKIPNTDIMGYIYIKKLNIDLPIYHSVDEAVLQIGIGHLQTSSLPVGGNSTHSVLMGHRGLPTAKLFTNLDRLEIGNIFVLKVLREKFYYKVDEVLTVEPDQVQDLIQIEENKDQVTLITCTPYGINTHRLLIKGTRTEDQVEDEDLEVILNKNYKNNILIIVTIILVAIILISTIITLMHERQLKKHGGAPKPKRRRKRKKEVKKHDEEK